MLPLAEPLLAALLSLFSQCRQHGHKNLILAKKNIFAFVALGIDDKGGSALTLALYKMHFETKFIDDTKLHYALAAESYIAQNSISDYIAQALLWIHDEQDRADACLHPTTKLPLLAIIEDVLVRTHGQRIQDEFHSLLVKDRIEHLASVYSLLSRVPETLDPLRTRFEEFVKSEGLAAVQTAVENAENGGAADDGQEGIFNCDYSSPVLKVLLWNLRTLLILNFYLSSDFNLIQMSKKEKSPKTKRNALPNRGR